MSDALRKTAGYAGIYAIGVLFNRSVSFIMLPIYTRVLTPDDYGVLELLVLTIDIVSIVTGLGILNGLHKFFYKYESEQDKREVVSTLFMMILGCYAVACAIGALVAAPISELVFESAEKAHLIRLTFVNLFLSFLVFVPLGYLQARQRPFLFVAVSCAKLVLQLGLNIVFVVQLRMGVIGVLYSTMIALTVIGGGLSLYTFWSVGVAFARDKARELFAFGYPFVFSGFAAFLTTYSDRYFLNHYQDTATVGLYALAYKFGFLLMFFPVSPLFRIWNVQRFELVKDAGYVAIFNRFLLWFSVIVGAVGLGIAVSVRDLLRLMSTAEFHSAWSVVPVILLAYSLQACTDYFNFGIYHAGQSKHMAIGTGLAAALILALSFWWIPLYGAQGAAWATLIAFALRLVYVYSASQRAFRIDYRLARPAAVAAVALLLFGCWRVAVQRFPVFDELQYSIPLSIALFTGFPLLLATTGILPPEDRGLLIDLIRSPRSTIAKLRARPL